MEEGAQRTSGVIALAERRWLEGRLTPRSPQAPPRRPRPAGPAPRDLNRAAGSAGPSASSPAALLGRVPSALPPRALRPPTDRSAGTLVFCLLPGEPGPCPPQPCARKAATPLSSLSLISLLFSQSILYFSSLSSFSLSLFSLFFSLPFVLYLSGSIGRNFSLHPSTVSPRPGCSAPPLGWGASARPRRSE